MNLGILVRSDGYILTVIDKQQDDLRIRTRRGTYSSKSIAYYKDTGLVLLKISGDGYPALELSESVIPEVDSEVYYFINKPNPNNELSPVSGKFKGIAEQSDISDVTLYQIESSISHSFRFSPVFSNNGELVGLLSLYSNTEKGIAFLFPINPIRQFLEQSLAAPSILLLTALKVETQAVLDVFSQATGHTGERQQIEGQFYYFLGKVGGANVYMLQRKIGRDSSYNAFLPIRQSIEYVRPRAIISVGVAIGLHPRKEKLGDILVAKQLISFESAKRDKKGGDIQYGDRINCSPSLYNKLQVGNQNWVGANIHFGLMLLGERVLADKDTSNRILKLEPELIGGEMEGAGLYKTIGDTKVDWVVVKSICDWADGNKNDASQLSAAQNAARFVHHVIQLGGWEVDTEAPSYNISGRLEIAEFSGRDGIIHYGPSANDIELMVDKVIKFLQKGGVFLPIPDELDALKIEHGGETLTFRPGAAGQLSGMRNERACLLATVIDREYQRWTSRFIPLAGRMDLRQTMEGIPISFSELISPLGEGGQATVKPLENIAEAQNVHGSFIILGEPGSGKTTTLQKIAFDAALAMLAGQSSRVPLFVRLSQQGEREPYEFLKIEWERRIDETFDRALQAGRILILVDGINEIPRQVRNQRLIEWMRFEQGFRGANQLIFSGREKDYDSQLNLPRVFIQPLDNTRIDEFLKLHKADGLRSLLDDPLSHLRDMVSNPLNLFILTMVYLQGGKNTQTLANRGHLLQSFTDSLMQNEQRWHPDDLSVARKTDLFAQLAFEMQKQSTGTTLDLKNARQILPGRVDDLGEEQVLDLAAFLRFGRGALILDPDTIPDVRFYHQSLQEYFAARELLRRFYAGENLSNLWKAPRLDIEMPPVNTGDWDPLPEPPTTGWEVTTILACGLARNPANLIDAVRLANPALAGRCLNNAGIFPPADITESVRKDLLNELYNPKFHLRARLQAGFVLGEVGDSRFQMIEERGVKAILPQIVSVPAGRYIIGSDKNDLDAYHNEKPQHVVDVPAFSIGKWPVTNAEFSSFIQAEGYEDRQWWTAAGRRWLKGEDVSHGQINSWMEIWKSLQAASNVRQQLQKSGNFTPAQIDSYEYIASLNENELKDMLSKQLSIKSRQNPAFWFDRSFNNPSQPVVGITWFEANAYCTWLSAVSGKIFRLPSEVEWEAAARGTDRRNYPWGSDWANTHTNTVEGRLLKPSPVGAYATDGGTGPFGAEDQVGNVYEWTASLYLLYPYDIRAREDSNSSGERVARGGGWDSTRTNARCAYRARFAPDDFSMNIGFRLCSSVTRQNL